MAAFGPASAVMRRSAVYSREIPPPLPLTSAVESLRPVARPSITLRSAALTKSFGENVALWGVDLEGRSGESIAINGPNGSGKSTLLRIIAGVMAPTNGRVAWTTTAPGVRPRIALLAHATHLFDELTVLENVALAARLSGRDASLAVDLLGRLAVERHAGRRVGALSSGTRRRVGLARLLATDPDALLVDEPFLGLDADAAALVANLLSGAREEGRLVIIATHGDAGGVAITGRSVRLHEGRIVHGSGAGAGASAVSGAAAR